MIAVCACAAVSLIPLPTFDTVRSWQLAGLFNPDGSFKSGTVPGAAATTTTTTDTTTVTVDPYQTCAADSSSTVVTGLNSAQCVAVTIDLLGAWYQSCRVSVMT